MTTGTSTKLWQLDKSPIHAITEARIPSKEQVLRYYHHYRVMGKTASWSTKVVMEELFPFWSRAGIPTTTVTHACTNLSKLIKTNDELKKNKNKDSSKHRVDEETFKVVLQHIFDIAHSSLQRADVRDDGKELIRSQREDRSKSSMAGIDVVTVKKVQKQDKRQIGQKRLREREDRDIATITERAELSSETIPSSSPVSTPSSPTRRIRRPTKQLLKKASPILSSIPLGI